MGLLTILLGALAPSLPAAAPAPHPVAAPAPAPVVAPAAQRGGRRARQGEDGEDFEPRRAVAPDFRKLVAEMPDGVTMAAEIYRVAGRRKRPRPVVVCLHGPESSRAEYRRIGPELQALGYHVLAVDLRCGGAGERVDPRTGARYGTPNETAASAEKVHGRPMEPLDGLNDLPFVMAWARRLFPESPVALLGSSLSASLALVYAAEHPDEVAAVLAFSPGEDLPGVSVVERVAELAVPAYVTCGRHPDELAAARPIAEAAPTRPLTLWPGEEGLSGDHGARVLLIPDARSRARQWVMVERVLGPLRRGESDE